MIDLHLNHGNSHEGVYLRLPATPGEVGEAFGLLEKLGEDAMVEDGVRQTEFGLVRRCSRPFPAKA